MVRFSLRVIAVGRLVTELAGGIELGQRRAGRLAGVAAAQADADDMQLFKARENAHAAARAWPREGEGRPRPRRRARPGWRRTGPGR